MGNLVISAGKSFIKQGVIGWSIIFIILILVVLSYKFSKDAKNIYKYLLEDFNGALEEKSDKNKNFMLKVFKDGALKDIDKQFKNSVQLGTDNINTEVIIRNNLDKKMLNKQMLAKSLPNTCIALGLVGTFLGLTTAIMGTTNSLTLGVQSIVEFSKGMQGPLSSMSSAFWTSIFGVLSSVILNINNVKMDRAEDEFYYILEDYLDNKVFAIYSKNLNNEFKEFNNVVRESMISLADDMKNLFKYGVDELVKGINKNNLDLTNTVHGLSNYTKDLDRLTNSLNISIENFKNPVDIFKASIYEFASVNDDIISANKANIGKLCEKLERLDSNLNYLFQYIDLNNKELKNISTLLKNQDKILENSYMKIIEAVDSLKNVQEFNRKDLEGQVNNLNLGYETFKKGMNEFETALSTIQIEISNGILNSFKEGMNSISNDIVEKIDESLIDIKKTAEQLNTNSAIVGQLVKATNEWVAATRENTIESL